MEKAYKFRIYPTKEQEALLTKTFGCVRFVYNHYLAKRNALYDEDRTILGYGACAVDLTQLKKEIEWLREPDSIALQAALEALQAGFDNFHRERNKGNLGYGLPKFKKKSDSWKSYTTKSVNGNIKLSDRHIVLPKLGQLRCKVSKQVEGRILRVTVSRNPSGKYFVSICCTGVAMQPYPPMGASVGIDLGLARFAVDSNGVEYRNNRYLRKGEEKLVRLQRQLSRKQIGSNMTQKGKAEKFELDKAIKRAKERSLF